MEKMANMNVPPGIFSRWFCILKDRLTNYKNDDSICHTKVYFASLIMFFYGYKRANSMVES